MQLTPKQRRFAEEYLVDVNGTKAAVRAGYSPHTANEQAARLLANVSVQEVIQELQEERSRRTGITAQRVLEELWDIAMADPNDLVEFRREACTGCRRRDGSVDPQCSECRGEGVGRVFVHDTRQLRGRARRLYAGLKQTRDGVQILLRNQDKALELVAAHLGMFRNPSEQACWAEEAERAKQREIQEAVEQWTPEQRKQMREAMLRIFGSGVKEVSRRLGD